MANEDKATRYHRLQRQAALAGTLAAALFLVLLLVSGAALWLRTLTGDLAGGAFLPSVALYVTALAIFSECIQLPFAYYQGVTLERRYGLSTQPPARWWLDRGKAAVVGLLILIPAALVAYALLRWWPAYWWIVASAVFTMFLVLLAQIAPVVLMPMFYDIKPLDRPALVERLLALARRADAPVLGVFEWRLSDRTRKANAALTGLGRTRRILLSDTLLAGHTDDEIEVILAHELAHHVHRDIWSGLALDGALVTAGFFAADAVLDALSPSLGLSGKADPAGLPLLILAAGAVSLLLVPLANAVSRQHERRADRYALDMTGNAEAFVGAMRKLSASNLSEEQPSRWVEMLFHSHPPTAARIAAARHWLQRQTEAGRAELRAADVAEP
jgi:STE24 endopeptidase